MVRRSEGVREEARPLREEQEVKNGEAPAHIIYWAPADWLTCRARNRSAMTGDPMLRTVYFELLNVMYANGGTAPTEPSELADLLLLPEQEIARCLPILETLGVTNDGKNLAQPRVAREIARLRAISSKRKTAAQARWDAADEAAPAKKGRETWLTPFGEAWEAALGGLPPYSHIAKEFKPLCERLGPEKVLEGWKRYLRETEGKFASPGSFARRVGLWVKVPAAPRPEPPKLTPQSEIAASLWAAARVLIEAPPHLKKTWLDPIDGWSIDKDGFLLIAPSKEHQSALLGRYLDRARAAITAADPQHRSFKIRVAVAPQDGRLHDGGL